MIAINEFDNISNAFLSLPSLLFLTSIDISIKHKCYSFR